MNTRAAGGTAGPTLEFAVSHGIMPALDLDSVDSVCRVVESTSGIEGVVGYKLGLTMVLRLGLAEAVRTIRELTDLPVLYDHQKAGPDVPDMADKFCGICREAGADGLILFPLAGPRAVESFVGRSLDNGLLPVVGGDLPLEDYNASGGGYVVDDALDRIFMRAADLGARHFIVPGNTAAKVRHHAGWLVDKVERPSLVIPGIGALGGTIGECFAEASGCNAYAVVGRAVYGAEDPAAAARELAAEALQFARGGAR